MLAEREKAFIISRASKSTAQQRIVCPVCSHTRSGIKKRERVMSITRDGDKVLYNCWHCTTSGAISLKSPSETPRMSQPKPVPNMQPTSAPSAALIAYLGSRGISPATVGAMRLSETTHFIRSRNGSYGDMPCMVFPYTFKGKPSGNKLRSYPEKGFAWLGGANTFWRLDDLDPSADTVIVTEGEMDAMSVYEAGFTNVVAVPNGAPLKVSNHKVDPTEDNKFQYAWLAAERLNNLKVLLLPDNDSQGQALAEELARRLGKTRCLVARVEEVDPTVKDVNDLLAKHGPSAVKQLIESARPWPIVGLHEAAMYSERVRELYDHGFVPGEHVGFSGLDELYSVAPGQLTLVTGIPGSGKSEFVDQIATRLAQRRGWKFAVCSFENPPTYHIMKLAEKIVGKPFLNVDGRMTQMELGEALKWVNDHFLFIEHSDGRKASIDSIIDKAHAAVQRAGVRGLIIDPYNYISRPVSDDDRETEQVALILSQTRQFLVADDVHGWFVAHPQKLKAQADGTIKPPEGYDVSGSANWYNMPDFGMTVHRVDKTSPFVRVILWKARWKWLGRTGEVVLAYDKTTGRYSEDLNDPEMAEVAKALEEAEKYSGPWNA